MDQTIVNWLFTAAGAGVGWILKVVWDAMQDLKKDIRQIERDLPEIYVRRDIFKDAIDDMKDDMRSGFDKIEDMIGVLFKKLDNKADK